MERSKKMNKEEKKTLKILGRVLYLGFSVVITIMIGVIIGFLLDNKYGTSYIKIITIILFTVIAIANFFITLLKVK